MSYKLILTQEAQSDLTQWRKSGQVKVLKKILSLFEELKEHPQTGTGHPEKLKDNLSGYWSRQIDKKNRMVYSIDDDVIVVEVLTLLSHYGDK